MTRYLVCALVLLYAGPLCAGTEGDFLQQGQAYLAEKAYDEAVKAFKQAIRIDPKAADAYKGLGLSYYNLGNGETAIFPQILEEAIAAYNQALSISPDAETLYNLGMSYLMTGEVTQARSVKQRLYPLDRDKANLLSFIIGAESDTPNYGRHSTTLLRSEEGEQRTAVKVHDRQVWVPVSFAHRGRSASAWLLLDTGATNTLISTALARQLGVGATELTGGMARLADGSLVRTGDVVVDQVRVGPKEKRDLKVKIIPSAGDQGIGLLGLDFLGEFLFTIDSKNGVIRWQ